MAGKSKVTVVGAGNIGGTIALHLAMRNYADVVLVDIVEGLPQGKALDILESGPIIRFDSSVVGTNDYEDTANSDIVMIVTSAMRSPRSATSAATERAKSSSRSASCPVAPP